MILLIAFVLILLVSAVSEKNLRPVLAAALLLFTFAGSRFCLRTVYEQRSDVKINEGAPMVLWVAMGMQKGEGAPGWSNGYILHNYWGASDFDGEASRAMAIQDIGDSLDGFAKEPSYATRFYLEKFTSQWNDPTYECFAMTHVNGSARGPIANSMFDGKLHALMTWFMNQYQSLVFIGVFLWLIFGFWKEKGMEEYILLITIIGGFLFHIDMGGKGTVYSSVFCNDASDGGVRTFLSFCKNRKAPEKGIRKLWLHILSLAEKTARKMKLEVDVK